MVITRETLEFIGSYRKFYKEAVEDKSSKFEIDGKYLIGYEHSGLELHSGIGSGVKKGDTCDREKAYRLLRYDMIEIEGELNKLPYTLNQYQFDALASFTESCGLTVLKEITWNGKASLKDIGNAIVRYDMVNGEIDPKLTERRRLEQQLFNKKYEGRVQYKQLDVRKKRIIDLQVALTKNYGVKLDPDGNLDDTMTRSILKLHIVQFNHYGAHVVWVQEMLRRQGYTIDVDGIFRKRAERKLIWFQNRVGVFPNGKANRKMIPYLIE